MDEEWQKMSEAAKKVQGFTAIGSHMEPVVSLLLFQLNREKFIQEFALTQRVDQAFVRNAMLFLI